MSTQLTAEGDLARTASPPSGQDSQRPRRSRLVAFLTAALGSFGLVTAIVVVQALLAAVIPPSSLDVLRGQSELQRHAVDIVVWLIAPIAVGAAYFRHRFAAYLGLLASLVAFLLLGGSRADLPQHEWSSFGRIIENIVLIGYAFLALLLVPLGAVSRARLSRRHSTPRRTPRAIPVIAAVATITLVVTLSLSALIPDGKAYKLGLSPQWVLVRSDSYDPTYGTQFTAELGPPERPSFSRPPTHPVVGVSVVSLTAAVSPVQCFRAFGPWPGNPMLSQSERTREGDVSLPVGPAYEWVGRRGGLTFYSYSFGRARRILFDSRQLCYMLVITVPDAVGMTESDARAIAESFRYR
jgi:hypothetical protein